MDKIKYIKIEDENGNLSDNIPIGADDSNIDTANGSSNLNKDLLNIQSTLRTQEKELNLLNSQISSWSNINPIAVDSIEDMTDTSKIYVLITDGNWYYYSDSWISGGKYQSPVESKSIDNLKKYKNNVAVKMSRNLYIDMNEDKTQLHIYTKHLNTESLTIYTEKFSFNVSSIDKTFTNDDLNLKYIIYLFVNSSTKELKASTYGNDIEEDDVLIGIVYNGGNNFYTQIVKNYYNSNYGCIYFNNQIVVSVNSEDISNVFLGTSAVIYISSETTSDDTFDLEVNCPYQGTIFSLPFSYSFGATSKKFNGLSINTYYYIGINSYSKEIFVKSINTKLDYGDCVIGMLNKNRFRNLSTLNSYNIFFNNIPTNPIQNINDNAYIGFGRIDITKDEENLIVKFTNDPTTGLSGSVFIFCDNVFGNYLDGYEYSFNTSEIKPAGTTAIVLSPTAANNQKVRLVYLNSDFDTLLNGDVILAYCVFSLDNFIISNCQNDVYFNGTDISVKGRILNEAKKDFENIIKIDYLRCFEHFTAIGDSLTAGYTQTSKMSTAVHERTEINTIETKTNWFAYLMNRLNKDGNNQAVSGSTTLSWRTEGYLEKVKDKTDCYFIALGVNDISRGGVDLGTSDDIKLDFNENPNTFYGNYDYIIRTLVNANPFCKIFIFTIPDRYTTVNAETYSDAIRYFSTIYSNVYLVDIRKEINQKSGTYIGKFWINGHLEPIGYNYISILFENMINKIIEDNYQDFMEIPLTNYEGFPIIQ